VNASLLGLLGLLIGSFLNVVIYRLARDDGGAVGGRMCRFVSVRKDAAESPVFNLMTPRSRCQHCGTSSAGTKTFP
jgi:leader peptidase (prepilin peptidase)/N-methyltransferase